MDWDNYRLILEIHRSGSIRSAAKAMRVDHSTISRRLARLRQSIGDAIFEKRADGLILTAAGQELLEAARQIEAIGFAATRRSRAHIDPAQYTVRLSAPPTICSLIIGDLKIFMARNPNILLILDASFGLADLDRSEADIVIRGTNAPPESLVGRRFFPYYLCLYGQTEYLRQTDPKDYAWISRNHDGERLEWMRTSEYPDAPVAIMTDDIMMRHDLAVRGVGLTCAACYMSDPHPALERLPGAAPFPAQNLWVLTHNDLRHVPAIKTTMRFLSDTLLKYRPLFEGKLPGGFSAIA